MVPCFHCCFISGHLSLSHEAQVGANRKKVQGVHCISGDATYKFLVNFIVSGIVKYI